jgi:hypothetical protein
MTRANAGGGLGSSVVNEQGQRLGAPREGVRPGYAGQLGQKQGSHITDGYETDYRGAKMQAPRPTAASVPLGNALATNVGAGGPGTGRTLYGQSGSQGQYGSGGPLKPGGRDILSDFGPDYRK